MPVFFLKDHTFFTESPYKRFSELYQVDLGFWGEMYHKKHRNLHYSTKDLVDYIQLKTGKRLHQRTVRRWIRRTDIYLKVKPLMDNGLEQVTDEFFGDDYEFIVRELNNYK